jgi:uncharacterized protein YbaR (Trm112 family)
MQMKKNFLLLDSEDFAEELDGPAPWCPDRKHAYRIDD